MNGLNPYMVVGSPSYAAPDISKFLQTGPQQGQPQQQQQGGQLSFMDALTKFLNGSNGQQMVGAPTVLQSAPQPQINAQGLGLY